MDNALKYFTSCFENYERRYEEGKREGVILFNVLEHTDYYESLLLCAEVYNRKNNVSAALADYEKAINRFPNNPLAYECRGNFYQNRKDKVKEKEDFAKVRELEQFI